MLVFALLGAAMWVLRRGGRLGFGGGMRISGRGRALESVERLTLTPQHSLHLVKIGGREVVVATYPQGCALLTDRTQGAGQ
jgi:flagellar biogenesis protein FliO